MSRVSIYPQSITVTPTVTAGAYSANFQVGGLQSLSGSCQAQNYSSELASLTLIDAAKQSQAMTIFLFDSSPTITSVDAALINIADSEMASKCVGAVSIATTDYKAVSGSSVATVCNIGLHLKSNDANGALYAVMSTTGTPTFTSTSDVTIKYNFKLN